MGTEARLPFARRYMLRARACFYHSQFLRDVPPTTCSMRPLAILFATATLLMGCGPSTPGIPDPAMNSFDPSLDVTLTTMTKSSSGLYVQELAAGAGSPAAKGDSISMHYTGWLPDGKKFDSSRDRGKPYSFVLGRGEVIRGWDEGVEGMMVGGRRKLVIPASLGYGERGTGPIPANATLVFDVERVK